MKRIFTIIISLLLCISHYSVAKTEAIDATALVEVTSQNRAQCVEYFDVKGTRYCSTKPLLTTRISKEIADAEMLQLNLDNHEWQVSRAEIKPDITTIEYVRHGQTVNDWKELVTTQFFPRYPAQTTPKILAINFLRSLSQKGLNPAVSYYAESNSEITFEFQIFTPEHQQQDEIQKIIMGPKGLHIIHYAVRRSDLGKQERDKWLTFIHTATIKSQPLNTRIINPMPPNE